MKNGKLGVCVVGSGDMGARHAFAWQKSNLADVISIASLNMEQACLLASNLGDVRCFSDFRQAIDLSEVDVVSICIPTNLHAEVSLYAAGMGKHILCEKPIALNLEEANKMIATARQNNVKLTIGFMRRHSSMIKTLHRLMSDRAFGRPVIYHCLDVREMRPKRMMHDEQATGGAVLDMGVHVFDAWNYLFDAKPVRVFARGLTIAQDRVELREIEQKAYDSAVVTVDYASGDIGSFVVTWGLPPHVSPAMVPDQVFAPNGLIEVDYNLERQQLRTWRNNNRWEVIESNEEDMYLSQIIDFARCIIEDREPLVSTENGRESLRIALGALESIRTANIVLL